MLLHLRRSNENLRALPRWVKLAIAVQCLLPGAVLWFQLKFLAYKSIETVQMVEMIQKMNTLPETHYRQLMSLYGDALQAGLSGSSAFGVLVWLNAVLAALGFALLILMTWKQKAKPDAPSPTAHPGQLDAARG